MACGSYTRDDAGVAGSSGRLEPRNGGEVLHYDAFWSFMSRRIGVPCRIPQRGSALSLDLLGTFGLISALDELGAYVPEGLAPQLVSAEDVYHHYVTRLSAERGARR